jgi:hypothetical protein
MSRIFISHSSANNDWAIRARDWLVAEGWGRPDDIFLDLDPERGIKAGERWRDASQKAAHRCEVVLALVSPEWIGSQWCKAELDAARLMSKKVIVALIGADKTAVPLDLVDEKWVDLASDPHGFDRLKEGLKSSGLDPSTFSFPEGRRPYPGFLPLVEEDAAIFFGRDAQIVRGLDRMRYIMRSGVDRMLVILGASGAGKSSFMRAGLWPRLRRNDREWLPIMTIRPERAVLSGRYGLAQALERTIAEPRFAGAFARRGLPRARGTIQDFIETDSGGLARLFTALREIGRVYGSAGDTPPLPTIVLPIDQGEELFNDDGQAETRRFVDILTRTLAIDRQALVLLAMRSDSFPRLQDDRQLTVLPKDTFTLDVMMEGAWRDVIEGPARLAKLEVDPELTEALLQDVTGQDALPLLAFTLEKLHETSAAEGRLSIATYMRLNRIKGVFRSVVEQAFTSAVAAGELPRDPKAQLAIMHKAFIPYLARVNAAAEFVRRVAPAPRYRKRPDHWLTASPITAC